MPPGRSVQGQNQESLATLFLHSLELRSRTENRHAPFHPRLCEFQWHELMGMSANTTGVRTTSVKGKSWSSCRNPTQSPTWTSKNLFAHMYCSKWDVGTVFRDKKTVSARELLYECKLVQNERPIKMADAHHPGVCRPGRYRSTNVNMSSDELSQLVTSPGR